MSVSVPELDHRLGKLMALGRGAALPAVRSPIHELVAEYARTEPDRVAVCGADGTISYADLHRWAGRIAARLHADGVGRGSRVGLLAAPSTAMVAAALGILRSGAAYVPVDQAQPDARIVDVFADARVAGVITTEMAAARLAGLGLPLITAEDYLESATDVDADDVLLPVVTDADPAYLIYTSGSTGEPKGVLVEHDQLAASTQARHLVYPGAPVFLLVSPLAFDSSVASLWGTLTAGGTVVVAAADDMRDPARLVELVHRHRVTALLCVPSLYAVLLDAANRVGVDHIATLDTVIVAGEPLAETLLARHFAVHGSGVALVNEYGPTEATVWASYRRYDAPGPVSIGGPIPGARLYVLDELLRPVPRDVEGELFIGGAGVSRGYFGRPEATAEAFLTDPFAGDGSRMYRTGDRARWTDDGTVAFLGRRDHQVKIRGHRIELSAVEAVLREVPGVRDAIVVPDSAHTMLVGFVLAEPAVIEAVRRRAADRLAPTMVPARIEALDSFPLTFTGKVDRHRLRAAADARPVSAPAPVPAGPAAMTGKVAAAWAEVLKVPHVPLNANFFELGGHSLTMFQLQDALEKHTGTRPSVVALFRHTTVSAQAALISGGVGEDGSAMERRQAAARRRAARTARRQPPRTTEESAA
jgi:amino acid adenylation domain-containing protein